MKEDCINYKWRGTGCELGIMAITHCNNSCEKYEPQPEERSEEPVARCCAMCAKNDIDNRRLKSYVSDIKHGWVIDPEEDAKPPKLSQIEMEYLAMEHVVSKLHEKFYFIKRGP